ncbi:probable pectinesterase 53 isoform X1 [Primulina huaijiensis]|uniref:probable pectinesterase 53 isoform X1 n=1 Tax=Primulina huaijiensis TaxID=1492673 RepID=UPI003CC77171
MLNFKQILYFSFLFLLLNASHTLCHLKELQPKESCSDEKQMKVNTTQELKPKKSDAGKQMEVNTTQESKPKKSDAGKQMEVNTTKESKPIAGKQMEVNTTQESKPKKSDAGKQMEVNTTQESKPKKSDEEKQMEVNTTQELKPKKSDVGKQMEVNTTQELKPKKRDVGKQMEVNTTQQLKPKKSDAGKQVEVNTTQESKQKKCDDEKQMDVNTTQESKPKQSDAGKQMEVNTTQESKPKQSDAGKQMESPAGKQMEVNTTQELKPKQSDAGKQVKVNATQAQHSELQFMKWISFVGKLKHTSFKAAKNKVTPSFFLTVDKNAGLGDFTCIQDAIDSLPIINLVRVVIKVHAGVYTEKVSIPATKSFISIEGAGAEKTIIQWGDTSQTIGPNGMPLGTFGSATFAVNSPYFIAKNITVKNTAPVPTPGAVGKQAVAFRISADTASLVGCKFLGAQDTLYDHLGRHYYKDCYIEGSVDFIFGNGLSMFENCAVHAIAGAIGAVTAQARKSILDVDSGFSFVNCKVTGSGALYLGRAWGAFSRVVFAYTHMDNIIIPKGWYNWGDPSREMTVFYGQYKCSGAGASHAGRVSWSRELTDEEAKPFISLTFIDGSEWVNM